MRFFDILRTFTLTVESMLYIVFKETEFLSRNLIDSQHKKKSSFK